MNRLEKKEVVSLVNEKLLNSYTVIAVHYKGLTVAEITKLRRNVRNSGAEFLVTKNSLVKIALAGTDFECLTDMMSGPTALAFSQDPIAAAKSMVDFANENDKLVILGGVANAKLLDVNSVKQLASMPSLDELKAKIIGILTVPATRIATVLQAPASMLARVLSAYASKGN